MSSAIIICATVEFLSQLDLIFEAHSHVDFKLDPI